MPLNCLAHAWPSTLAPLWFFILMSCLHGGQLRRRMTNSYLLLISFVVKRPLIRDCLAEIALHEMQLEQGSQAGLAEEHFSLGCHLPFEGLVITSPPLETSPPSARSRASCPVHSKGSRKQ